MGTHRDFFAIYRDLAQATPPEEVAPLWRTNPNLPVTERVLLRGLTFIFLTDRFCFSRCAGLTGSLAELLGGMSDARSSLVLLRTKRAEEVKQQYFKRPEDYHLFLSIFEQVETDGWLTVKNILRREGPLYGRSHPALNQHAVALLGARIDFPAHHRPLLIASQRAVGTEAALPQLLSEIRERFDHCPADALLILSEGSRTAPQVFNRLLTLRHGNR